MTLSQALRRAGLLAAAALLSTVVGMNPLHAIETATPAPPPDPLMKKNTDQQKPVDKPKKAKKKKKPDEDAQKKSDADFLRSYRAARALMLEHKYEAGIAAMHAIGHDEHPDIANYIGYAYRKLGDYEDSKIWYEKALAADPDHVRTWSYYGMWQMEQGNRLKAEEYLAKVATICGDTRCEGYRKLKAVIDGRATY